MQSCSSKNSRVALRYIMLIQNQYNTDRLLHMCNFLSPGRSVQNHGVLNGFGSAQRRDSFKNTHYARPDHSVPTHIQRLPARQSAVITHPLTLSRMPPEKYLKGKTTPFHRSYYNNSVHISQPPLSLGEFNKSAPYIFTMQFGALKKPSNLYFGRAQWVKI